MRVCVIIPNFNGERLLGPCLDSLCAQTRPAECVIVVDNASQDRSREIVRAHRLGPRLLELERNHGFAAAVNRGIEQAEAEIIALLNNDAVADSGWIEAGLTALFKNPGVSMIASLMLERNQRGRVDSAGDVYLRDGRPRPRGRGRAACGYGEPMEVFSACAGAAFFRKDLLDELGGFEPGFFAYLEDIDLGFRARVRGHACLFAPDAVVLHAGAATRLGDRPGSKPVDSSERVRLIARNRVRVVARNWPAKWLARWSPRLACGFMRSAAYHVLVSRQAAAFFRGLGQGVRLFRPDRSYFHESTDSLAEKERSFDDLADLMRRGVRPWAP